MRRRAPWLRLLALALSACLLVHAILRALAHLWLGEAATAIEAAAAVLLARHRPRAAEEATRPATHG